MYLVFYLVILMECDIENEPPLTPMNTTPMIYTALILQRARDARRFSARFSFYFPRLCFTHRSDTFNRYEVTCRHGSPRARDRL